MKMEMKMKSRSHRYDISRRRSRLEQKYREFKVSQYGYACSNT